MEGVLPRPNRNKGTVGEGGMGKLLARATVPEEKLRRQRPEL